MARLRLDSPGFPAWHHHYPWSICTRRSVPNQQTSQKSSQRRHSNGRLDGELAVLLFDYALSSVSGTDAGKKTLCVSIVLLCVCCVIANCLGFPLVALQYLFFIGGSYTIILAAADMSMAVRAQNYLNKKQSPENAQEPDKVPSLAAPVLMGIFGRAGPLIIAIVYQERFRYGLSSVSVSLPC